MALKAEERLVLFEHVIGHGSVSIVTEHAVFLDRSMFENEWALFVRMAIEAKIVHSLDCFQVFHQRAVMLVTTATFHLSLSNGVTGREINLGRDLPMTIQTELWIFFNKSFLIVNCMAA